MKIAELKKSVKPLDPTNERILHLEKKLQLSCDDNSSLRSKLAAVQRDNGLFEAMAEEVQKHVKQIPSFPKEKAKPTADTDIVEDLCLHLSDEHADQIVLPHRVNGLENYNFKVVMARAERLVQVLLDYSQKTLVNYTFENLYIFANGDHVNGEIHDSTNQSEYRNAFRNTLAVGQLHALMIRDLAPHFKKVFVIYTAGNHGRRSRKKDYTGAWDNWDYLVGEYAKQCTTAENVEFIIPDSWSVNVDIRGWVFNIQHGDDVKSWNSIPFYGLERQSRRLMALEAAQNRQVHYFVRGHFHQLGSISHPGGEMLLNGAWKATDEWALGALGAYGKPTQLMHGVHEKYGVTWRLPIDLKFNGDHKGPKRYSVKLADPDESC